MTHLTQEEKIDYIYNHIKTKKRNTIIKIIFKIVLIISIIFSTYYVIKNLWEEQIKKTISEQIWDITWPIIKDLVKDLDTSSINWINKETFQNILKENPELLDNY